MLKTHFNPFPVLITERLHLRQMKLGDYRTIHLRSDPNVNKFLNRPRTTTLFQAKDFIRKIDVEIKNGDWIYWAITMKARPQELIGTMCLWNISKPNQSAEIGYELVPDAQGMGLAHEAVARLIEFGFDQTKIRTLQAYTHKANRGSCRLLEKYGFQW